MPDETHEMLTEYEHLKDAFNSGNACVDDVRRMSAIEGALTRKYDYDFAVNLLEG